jgi:hypothetical protein
MSSIINLRNEDYYTLYKNQIIISKAGDEVENRYLNLTGLSQSDQKHIEECYKKVSPMEKDRMDREIIDYFNNTINSSRKTIDELAKVINDTKPEIIDGKEAKKIDGDILRLIIKKHISQ